MDNNYRNMDNKMIRDLKNHKFHLETKKRCKALEDRMKEKSQLEEERRKEILNKRREELKMVTENFQHFRRNNRSASQINKQQGNYHWQSNYNLDEALRIVLGTNTAKQSSHVRSSSATTTRSDKIKGYSLRPVSSDSAKRLNSFIPENKFNILPSSPQIQFQAFDETSVKENIHASKMPQHQVAFLKNRIDNLEINQDNNNYKEIQKNIMPNCVEKNINRPTKFDNTNGKQNNDGYTNKWKMRSHLSEPCLIAVDPTLTKPSNIDFRKSGVVNMRKNINTKPHRMNQFGIEALNHHTNYMNKINSNIKATSDMAHLPVSNLKFDSTINEVDNFNLKRLSRGFEMTDETTLNHTKYNSTSQLNNIINNEISINLKNEEKFETASQDIISQGNLGNEKSENAFYLHRNQSPNIAIVQPMLHLLTDIFHHQNPPTQQLVSFNNQNYDNNCNINSNKDYSKELNIVKDESTVAKDNEIDYKQKVIDKDSLLDNSLNHFQTHENLHITYQCKQESPVTSNIPYNIFELEHTNQDVCNINLSRNEKYKNNKNSLIPKPLISNHLQKEIYENSLSKNLQIIEKETNFAHNSLITSKISNRDIMVDSQCVNNIDNSQTSNNATEHFNTQKQINKNNNLATFYASKNITIPTLTNMNTNFQISKITTDFKTNKNNENNFFKSNNSHLNTQNQLDSVHISNHFNETPLLNEISIGLEYPKGILKRPYSYNKLNEINKRSSIPLQRSFSSDAIPCPIQPKKSVRFANIHCSSSNEINNAGKLTVPSPPQLQKPNGYVPKIIGRAVSARTSTIQKNDIDVVRAKSAEHMKSNPPEASANFVDSTTISKPYFALNKNPTDEEIDSLWVKVKDVLNNKSSTNPTSNNSNNSISQTWDAFPYSNEGYVSRLKAITTDNKSVAKPNKTVAKRKKITMDMLNSIFTKKKEEFTHGPFDNNQNYNVIKEKPKFLESNGFLKELNNYNTAHSALSLEEERLKLSIQKLNSQLREISS